jgi:anti-anti-sigma regulatory factor
MYLKISKKKSVYHLKGVINKLTVKLFLDYFKIKIKSKKKIVLNIDETKQIDRSGLNALKQILKKGTKKSKDVFIVGNGCKEIYDDMYQTKIV